MKLAADVYVRKLQGQVIPISGMCPVLWSTCDWDYSLFYCHQGLLSKLELARCPGHLLKLYRNLLRLL